IMCILERLSDLLHVVHDRRKWKLRASWIAFIERTIWSVIHYQKRDILSLNIGKAKRDERDNMGMLQADNSLGFDAKIFDLPCREIPFEYFDCCPDGM